MQPILRQATTADAARIAEIYLAARKRYLPYAPLAHSDVEVRVWIAEKLLSSGDVMVAMEQGAVLGFVATSKDDSCGWIDHLYLDPSAVSRGLGTLLLTEATNRLGAPIRLYTFQRNESARRFYRRHGFREIEFTDGSLNEEKVPDVLLEWP